MADLREEGPDMPVIRVSDETWERLKKFAIPLEDNADDAVRRVLDAAEEYFGPSEIHRAEPSTTTTKLAGTERQRTRGRKVPQGAFERPICEALYELGGEAAAKGVLSRVEESMKDVLGEYDYERLPSGDLRWWKTANFARLALVRKGLLRDDSPRGIWELSENGVAAAERKAE